MENIILDPFGDNPNVDGFDVVEDEISLLKGFILGRPLLVRHRRLCRWATDIADVRKITVILRKSPVQEILEDVPSLTEPEVREILEGVDLNGLERPATALSVAKSFWLDTDIWSCEPCDTHAFKWLLWLQATSLSPQEAKMVARISQEWESLVTAPISVAYSASTKDVALELTLQWLKVTSSEWDWPDLSMPLPPSIIQRVSERWKNEIVLAEGKFFHQFLKVPLNKELTHLAAKVSYEYFKSNPNNLSPDILAEIKPYLSLSEGEELQTKLPAVDPGTPPQTFTEIVSWFKNLYLPFREKCCDPSHRERVLGITREFAAWFLEFYASSRMGGEGSDFISWSKTSGLLTSQNEAIFLVVLDGLSVRDAEVLAKLFNDRSSKIYVHSFDVLLAPVPTITSFAKSALLTGVSPAYALDEDIIGTRQRRIPEVVAALDGCTDGQIVIWSHQEPDCLYHHGPDPISIKMSVSGWLQGLCDTLLAILDKVNESKKVRTIITTDHGRMLSVSSRTHPIPPGMVAQGRAAWGGGASVSFPACGYVLHDSIAYLHPDRFGTKEVVGLVLDDNAFVTSDGKGGVDYFSHGGIFPEEVLIPWLELRREEKTVAVAGKAIGTGTTGKLGQLDIEIVNTGDVTIRLLSLSLSGFGYQTNLNITVNSMSKERFSVQILTWPSANDVKAAVAELTFETPTGERRIIELESQVKAEEMYQQDDILRDL